MAQPCADCLSGSLELLICPGPARPRRRCAPPGRRRRGCRTAPRLPDNVHALCTFSRAVRDAHDRRFDDRFGNWFRRVMRLQNDSTAEGGDICFPISLQRPALTRRQQRAPLLSDAGVHTIPPASSVTPTKKSVVSSGVSIQFLRILRLDRCTCLGAGSLQTINEWLKTPSDLLKAMFGRQMGSRCASSLS